MFTPKNDVVPCDPASGRKYRQMMFCFVSASFRPFLSDLWVSFVMGTS